MASGFDVSVLGVPETAARLRALPLKLQRKIIRPSMRDGAKVIATAAAAEARATLTKSASPPPHVADTIKVRAGKAKRRGDIRLIVVTGGRAELGIPDQTKAGQERGYYPTAIEYGWTPNVNRRRLARLLRSEGRSRGVIDAIQNKLVRDKKVPGNPFMGRALDRSRDQAISAIAAGVSKRIEDMTKVVDDVGQTATLETPVSAGEVLA